MHNPVDKSNSRRIIVHGFPAAGGGAGTELRHQIRLWRKMGLPVTVIPSSGGTSVLPEYAELKELGVDVRLMDQWEILKPGEIVLSFCNDETLKKIDRILERGCHLAFVNCMTELFEREKALAKQGKIAAFVFQNPEVRAKLEAALRTLNPPNDPVFADFEPWLDPSLFPFYNDRAGCDFTLGHISRADPLKFSAETVLIYESVRSPVPKKGIFLGFNHRCAAKTGRPPDWIKLYADHARLPPQEFYRQCDVILQPTDTTENWPRIGLEAMASGTVLVVDRRGGWTRMIEHGETGFLCSSPGEFIEYASELAHNRSLREKVSRQAHESFREKFSSERCARSWEGVLEALYSPHTSF